jgi:hypothetical protein
MDSLEQKFPEIKCSADAAAIPWENAVVWSVMARVGPRVYEWIEASHIRYVSWTNGIVNIMPESSSMLSDKCQCIVLPSAFTWIGRNVKTM